MKNSNEVYENPKKALNKLTIPILITSLIGNINGMINIVFVSLLGIGELSVLSLLTPFYILIFVLGISIGIGTNVLMSRYIGKEDTDSANKIFNNSIFIALIIGIILTVMISLFNKQIFALFGVPNNLYNFAMEYSVIFYGSIIFLMQGILSAIFNVELKPKLNIYYSILTAIINIILNYLLMFILGLGIFGIGLSTLLSSLIIVIGMSILLYVKDDWIVNYHISFQFFDLKRIHNLFSITIPSFLESNISTVFNIILNHLLLIVGGSIAVGIYTGAWHLIFIGCIAVGAYKSSLNTIVSMFYGQGDLKTIKELYFYSIRNTSIAGFILMIVFNIFHNNLAMIISKDPTLMIGIGTTISILSSLFLVIPFASLSGSVFVSIDKPRLSLLLSFLKYLVLELGFILIFIYFGFGTNGICYGVIAGCTVGCIISFILLSKFFKEHIDLNKIEENIE